MLSDTKSHLDSDISRAMAETVASISSDEIVIKAALYSDCSPASIVILRAA